MKPNNIVIRDELLDSLKEMVLRQAFGDIPKVNTKGPDPFQTHTEALMKQAICEDLESYIYDITPGGGTVPPDFYEYDNFLKCLRATLEENHVDLSKISHLSVQLLGKKTVVLSFTPIE